MAIVKEQIALSLDDVLLRPRFSTIKSRFDGEIDLSVELVKGLKIKYPIVGANMDTVCEERLASTLFNLGGLGIIHRFLSIEKQFDMLIKITGPKVLCIGTSKDELDRIKYFQDKGVLIDAIAIDTAHGHSLAMLEQINRVKDLDKELSMIVGDVATYDGVRDLAECGADCIRVNVGGGCLAAGTRILMADGSYKDIEKICLGDRVINKEGKPVNAIGVKASGIKKVLKYHNNLFNKITYITEDHLHWVGDYSTSSNMFKAGSLYKSLDKNTALRESKYKWLSTNMINKQVCLMPKNINFEMKDTFTIDLKEISLSHRNWKGFIEYPLITPSYDLGYIFGCFLGDGSTSLKYYKRGETSRNLTGSLKWYFGLNEQDVAEKLQSALNNVFGKFANTKIEIKENVLIVLNQSNVLSRLFMSFDKKENKHLPKEYWCSNKEYVSGLLDGLIDSDGTRANEKEVRQAFNNTSPELMELFMWAFKHINGYYPSIQIRPPRAGGLKNCNIDNCKESFVARSVNNSKVLCTKDYQINRIYGEIEDTNLFIPTFDIEVDCPTHSFIANNVIVHNSLCSTRIQTGNGIPIITSLMEGRKAIDDYWNSLYDKSDKFKPTLICDGGVKNSGDIIKALAAGADAVMTGNLFAGTDETPGKLIKTTKGMVKNYRGMSSREFQEDWRGFATSVEGETKLMPYKGSVVDVFNDLIAGMLSGMSYQNARTIKQLQENAEFMRITTAGLRESLPHALFREG